MSDRHHAYTVVLQKELKDEDSINVIEAIRMIKGVADVVPQVADHQFYVGREQARRELLEKVFNMLAEKTDGRRTR